MREAGAPLVAVTVLEAGGALAEGVATIVDGHVRVSDARGTGLPRLDGVIVGGLTDHHVHLQLVDTRPLEHDVLGRVVDLGGALPAAGAPRDVDVRFAGAFLTPPGGYPSDRAWAPAGSVREIASADDAERAVAEMADAGASLVKVASNRAAGPVLDDALLRRVVSLAAARGLPVVLHAEGVGEARRARRCDVAMLAHAPFSERLSDAEIDAQAAAVTWISTLAIHDGAAREIAIDNVRRFHAAGGTVRYGTDMGNGPTPVGLHAGEVSALREAGLDARSLLCALSPVDPYDARGRLVLLPTDLDPRAARPLVPADLETTRA